MTNDIQIAFNREAHDRVAKRYDNIHFEIFSKEEQNRIRTVLAFAKTLSTESSPSALDLGCGTGNLTNHLLELDYVTTSADISSEFLKIVSQKHSDNPKHNTQLINGKDLSNIPSETYSLVATYSVLHHIPDYMGMISEMLRILKPGGLMYIDHEAAPQYWNQCQLYKEFKSLTKWHIRKANYQTYLKPQTYLTYLRQIHNPRYRPEGDIHVFKDDHIEWAKIRSFLEAEGANVIKEVDYLLHKKGYPKETYNKYAKQCSDYRYLICIKQSQP